MIDVDIPEVRALRAQPRFYRNENGVDFVEISYIGVKDTNIHKVKPKHMAMFRDEWSAYCDGRPMAKRAGTPLTDMPEINAALAKELTERNVHNLEELAVLSDAQCQGLGHGMITNRKKANQLLAQRELDGKSRANQEVAERMAGVGSTPVGYVPPEIQSVFSDQDKKIAALTSQVSALVDIMTKLSKPAKRGRPRKGDNGSIDAE
jgi:hypothetical protein